MSMPNYKKRKASSANTGKSMKPYTKVSKQAYMKVQRVVPDRMAERKYVDTILAMTVTGSTTGVLLNGVAEGSDNTNRIGRKTLIKSVSIKGQFAISQTDLGSVAFPENGDTVKVAIVLDT